MFCNCPAVVLCLLQGLEAILRVRCSQGLDVDGYVGSFYKPPNSPTDLYLPAIDCDKALVARLEIMEKMPANSEVRHSWQQIVQGWGHQQYWLTVSTRGLLAGLD